MKNGRRQAFIRPQVYPSLLPSLVVSTSKDTVLCMVCNMPFLLLGEMLIVLSAAQ